MVSPALPGVSRQRSGGDRRQATRLTDADSVVVADFITEQVRAIGADPAQGAYFHCRWTQNDGLLHRLRAVRACSGSLSHGRRNDFTRVNVSIFGIEGHVTRVIRDRDGLPCSPRLRCSPLVHPSSMLTN
jgi:hypothetical protein